MENNPSTEQKIIVELVAVIKKIKKENLQVHKRLIMESETSVKLYTQILSELRRQNLILDDANQEKRLVRVTNATV